LRDWWIAVLAAAWGRRAGDSEQKIHESLNVNEQWNGANDFVFFARRGEFASNRREDHEVGMLSMHLLQNCMVYANTLIRPGFREGLVLLLLDSPPTETVAANPNRHHHSAGRLPGYHARTGTLFNGVGRRMRLDSGGS
jgi:hypothetical protein